jgi:hypothetical protein
MFTRVHFVQALEEVAAVSGRLRQRYGELLDAIEDEDFRIRIMALRQDLQRRTELLERLKAEASR